VLGQKAIAALLATIDHPDHKGLEIPIPTSLVVRASTGRARTQPRAAART
jgi:DNA-binding LacI/PurR family transcriptional regulator